MLRVTSALAFAFLSTSSFAFTAEHCGKKFTGGGQWKGADGVKGKWSEVLEIKKGERGVSISQTVTTEREGRTDTHKAEWSAVEAGKGFFDVVKDDKVVGTGYCLGPVCHYGFATDQGKVEETFKFSKKGLHKIGSMLGKDETVAAERVAWHGGMKSEEIPCEEN